MPGSKWSAVIDWIELGITNPIILKITTEKKISFIIFQDNTCSLN